VVAPPRRSFKTPPNQKLFTFLNILFFIRFENQLSFHKQTPNNPRSTNEDSEKEKQEQIPSLPHCFGSDLQGRAQSSSLLSSRLTSFCGSDPLLHFTVVVHFGTVNLHDESGSDLLCCH